MPDDADPHEAHDIKGNEGDNQNDADGALPDEKDEADDGDGGGEVITKKEEEGPQEGEHQTLPYFRKNGEELGEGDFLGREDAGDGVDDGGGGEEGED